MNLTTKKINDANAIANGVIAKTTLEDKITKIATRLSKTMKIDGFRKGKVPLHLVKARYKDGIKQDAQKEAVQDMLTQAIQDLKIEAKEVIGDPVITKFEEKGEDIDVEIKISLTPQINLDSVSSCIPDVKIPSISEKEVKERLDEIAVREAPLVEAKKGTELKKDHVAVFDFEGFIDGKPFEGGKAENFELMIGSGRFIAGFEDGMMGMRAGEDKEINVTFPQDYQAQNLAGKDAVFKVVLHAIKIKDKAKADDALAKKLLPQKEDATLKDLNEQIKTQLELEAKTKLYNEELKEKLVNALVEKITFDLPDLIVEQEMDMLFRNAINTMSEDELKALQSDANKAKEKRESFRADAQKSVCITFIVDALAKRENVSVSDNEVFQTIYYEAMMMGQNPNEVIEYYKNNNILPAVKMAMIEDRILHHLLDSKVVLVQEDAQNKEQKKATKASVSKTTKTAKTAKAKKEEK